MNIAPSSPLFSLAIPSHPRKNKALESSLGVWGSAVSSPVGAWREAPAEIEFTLQQTVLSMGPTFRDWHRFCAINNTVKRCHCWHKLTIHRKSSPVTPVCQFSVKCVLCLCVLWQNLTMAPISPVKYRGGDSSPSGPMKSAPLF